MIKKEIKYAISSGFETKCLDLLIVGYIEIVSKKSYDIHWQETDFSKHLATKMLEISQKGNLMIMIDCEAIVLDSVKNTGDAKQSPRIDIKMQQWMQVGGHNVYSIEAKNICENDWQKGSVKVSAASLRRAYVEEGIKRFINEQYPNFKCMIGFVTNGNIDNIVTKINEYCQKLVPSIELVSSMPIKKYNCIYKSKHMINDTPKELCHIMLNFSNIGDVA